MLKNDNVEMATNLKKLEETLFQYKVKNKNIYQKWGL